MPPISSDIQSFDQSITSITFPKYSCNNRDCIEFNLSRFSLIESIEIGGDCFESVQTFKMEGLNRLKTIKVGSNSFTQLKSTDKIDWKKANNKSKSFHILNCKSLESIFIGEYSFGDFGGEFELKNLPQLRSIQFDGYNFYYSSFVIRGIFMILNIE